MPIRRRSGGSAQPARPTISSPEPNDAVIGRLEAGDQPQQRGLAAARWTEQRKEFAVSHRQIDAAHGERRAKPLRHAFEPHARHGTTPSGRLRLSTLAMTASRSVTATDIVATAAAAGEFPS